MHARWHTLASIAIVVVLSVAGCSSSDAGTSGTSGGDGGDTGVSESGTSEGGANDTLLEETSSETPPTCPPNDNPSGCPDHYFEIPKGAACSPVGLTCKYYGEGDEPCPSYAACSCEVPTGSDGGTASVIWMHCVQ